MLVIHSKCKVFLAKNLNDELYLIEIKKEPRAIIELESTCIHLFHKDSLTFIIPRCC